jgi:hypothetical protein
MNEMIAIQTPELLKRGICQNILQGIDSSTNRVINLFSGVINFPNWLTSCVDSSQSQHTKQNAQHDSTQHTFWKERKKDCQFYSAFVFLLSLIPFIASVCCKPLLPMVFRQVMVCIYLQNEPLWEEMEFFFFRFFTKFTFGGIQIWVYNSQPHPQPSLCTAVREGQLYVFRRLVEQGHDVNAIEVNPPLVVIQMRIGSQS